MARLPAALSSGEFVVGSPSSYVYTALAADGDALYVGVSDNLHGRIGTHFSRAPWFPSAVRIAWQQYATRADAERVEQYLIETLMPRHNIAYNGRRAPADRMGHRCIYEPAAWQRLGVEVRARRESTRMSQRTAAREAGMDLAVWRQIEGGECVEYPPALLAAVERVLSWRDGSLEDVLAGAVPDPLTEDECMARAIEAGRRMADLRAL